ncbi:MAG TPA: PQQ-binding-like beta-propeller repeat protein, partial [Pyrinomonadaceae bacterium]
MEKNRFRKNQLQKSAACFSLVLWCALAPQVFAGARPNAAAARDAAPRWSAKLDGEVRFYLPTEMGVLVAGTERSLYAVDAETGEIVWRRKDARLDESDVAPVPGTDLLLLSFERGDKTRLEAVDVLTGGRVWQSEKVRGAPMHLAVDADARLLAAVFARDARGRAREGFKKRPVVHVFDLGTGEERWERKLDSEVEMLPARWPEKEDADVAYSLDNYRAPLFLDGRLYLFYEGITSLDAATGEERRREKFRVNEEGLALTDADPVFDEESIYASGRGRVRAISRATGEEVWEAKDLGLTPELIPVGDVLYVRTGGQFTRLKDGEIDERGPYGVSALDRRTGKTLWRYKGADKGITNLALPDAATILIADRDDLISIDTRTGKRRAKIEHGVERAAFVLLNEAGLAVVGGRNAIAGLDAATGRVAWRAQHNPPGRGILRTVTAVAARAAALYFRYGGAATTVFRGAQVARGISGLRTGLRFRAALPSLQALAADTARDYVTQRVTTFGAASQLGQLGDAAAVARRAREVQNLRTPRVGVSAPSIDVEERLLDRLDPARQLERLSAYLLRRRRLAALRGQWMYFYTNLPGGGGRGLAGVNVNNGRADRAIPLGDPDERFLVDEVGGLLHTAR